MTYIGRLVDLGLTVKETFSFSTVQQCNLASNCEISGIFKGVFTNGFLKVESIIPDLAKTWANYIECCSIILE